jgi:putative sigma-54 modulation protein
MQISVTFRHVDPTPALRAYAEEKLGRIKKYLRRPVDAHVILSVVKERHVAEITLKADHVTMFAQEQTRDLYSAIDLALDKIEHQAQKLKTRRRRHKGGAAARGAPPRAEGPPPAAAPEPRGPEETPEVVRSAWLPGKPLSIEDAIEQLRASGDEFLVFLSAANQSLAVLYRRRDGRYGLIEPKAG